MYHFKMKPCNNDSLLLAFHSNAFVVLDLSLLLFQSHSPEVEEDLQSD